MTAAMNRPSRRLLQALVLLLPLCCVAAPPARTAETQPLPDFRKLVKQNEPAVVNISSTQAPSKQDRPANPACRNCRAAENPYLEFFKRFFQERPSCRETANPTPWAPGSSSRRTATS
jgi:serine protease Do